MAQIELRRAARKVTRRTLAACASTAALSLAAPAIAQTDEAAFIPEAAAESGGVNDEIVVTGSRIARPALEAPAPITSIDSINIQRSGETNLVELLNEVPSLVGSVDNDDSTNAGIGATGLGSKPKSLLVGWAER